MITTLLTKAKQNPLLSGAWALFTLCVGCIISLELSFPDTADYFEKANLDITNARLEIAKAHEIVDSYRAAIKTLQATADSSNRYVDERFPNISVADARLLRDSLLQQRQTLSKPLIQLNTVHSGNNAFADLFKDLLQDALYADDFLVKRIKFIDLMMTDFGKAKEMRPSMDLGIAETRKFGELETRNAAIDEAFEKARLDFNAKLRTAQRKEALYKLQSKTKIAACGYIGAFVGAWGGFFLSRLRKRKKARL